MLWPGPGGDGILPLAQDQEESHRTSPSVLILEVSEQGMPLSGDIPLPFGVAAQQRVEPGVGLIKRIGWTVPVLQPLHQLG